MIIQRFEELRRAMDKGKVGRFRLCSLPFINRYVHVRPACADKFHACSSARCEWSLEVRSKKFAKRIA